jgi:hypothetical protein
MCENRPRKPAIFEIKNRPNSHIETKKTENIDSEKNSENWPTLVFSLLLLVITTIKIVS